jgi:hypothetical protein
MKTSNSAKASYPLFWISLLFWRHGQAVEVIGQVKINQNGGFFLQGKSVRDIAPDQPLIQNTEFKEKSLRALVQRVFSAQVQVSGKTVGKIKQGILLYLGVEKGDEEKDLQYLCQKVLNLRIFTDEAGK